MATITRDLGPVTAYKYAVSKGYTGTEEEFAELMADLASMSSRIIEMEDDVEQVEGTVNSLDDDLTIVENTVTSQGTRLTTAEADISNVKPRVTSLETKVTTLETNTSPKSVSLTATAGTNCGYVTVNQAYVSAGVLYVKFSVRPIAGLTSSTANVDFTISGITPAIKPDWRIGYGVIGAVVYGAWIADQNGTIRCRRMDGNVWSSDTTTVIFSGVIPLAS